MIVLAVLGPFAVYATALAVAVDRRRAALRGHRTHL